MISTVPVLVVCALVCAAAWLQASVGMGFGLLVTPALGLVDPALLPVTPLATALVVSGLMFLGDRPSSDIRSISWALAGRVPGTIIGVIAVTSLSRRALSIAAGIAVLVGVVLGSGRFHIRRGRRAELLAGSASGVLGTISSTGAPPIALLYRDDGAGALRANVGGLLLVGTAVSLAGLAGAGAVETRQVEAAFALAPFAAGGVLLTRVVRLRLDGQHLRRAVSIAASASALALIAAGVL
jgi:uncharacterized membrane protein YfcA